MASFKEALDVGLDFASIGMDVKNFKDIARLTNLATGGLTSFLGKKAAPVGGGNEAEVVKENEMQLGELYSLLGYLSGVRYDDSGTIKPITDYRAMPEEAGIYPAILRAMKPGAAGLLARTVGVNVVRVKKRRVVGESEFEVEGGKKRKVPITEESEEMKNLTGPEITGALTWLVLHKTGSREQQIAEVISDINAFQLFNSKLDAAKELGAKSAAEAKKLMGWLDTHAHIVSALMTLGPTRFKEFIERPETDRSLARIKAARTPESKRRHQEAFQGELVALAEEVNQERVREDHAAWKRLGWRVAITIAGLTGALIFTRFIDN